MDILQEIKVIRNKFKQLKLDPDEIMVTDPNDPQRTKKQLTLLLNWVQAYKIYKNRKKMEEMGYSFPPVWPDCDPESDWLKFENWLNHISTTFKITEAIIPEKLRAEWSDKEYKKQLKITRDFLEKHNIVFDLDDEIPAKQVYKALEKMYGDEEFEKVAEGTTIHLNFCNMYCDECFQRKWCDIPDLYAPEDE